MVMLNGIRYKLLDSGPHWLEVECIGKVVFSDGEYEAGDVFTYYYDKTDRVEFLSKEHHKLDDIDRAWSDLTPEQREEEAKKVIHLSTLLQEGKYFP